MTDIPDGEVTALLAEFQNGGDHHSRNEVLARLYPRLRQLAGAHTADWHGTDSLQVTGLLHEAILRLSKDRVLQKAPNREYLLGAASRAMRHILIERARKRKSERAGGNVKRLPADRLLDYCEQAKIDVNALNDALEVLAHKHERPSQVIVMRIIGGYNMYEIAELLAVSLSTVEKDYRFARAWLYGVLGENADHARS